MVVHESLFGASSLRFACDDTMRHQVVDRSYQSSASATHSPQRWKYCALAHQLLCMPDTVTPAGSGTAGTQSKGGRVRFGCQCREQLVTVVVIKPVCYGQTGPDLPWWSPLLRHGSGFTDYAFSIPPPFFMA